MTSRVFALIIVGVVLLVVVWWLRKRVAPRFRRATDSLWTWEAVIHTALWDVWIFGAFGLLLSFKMVTGQEFDFALPDPTAPTKSISRHK